MVKHTLLALLCVAACSPEGPASPDGQVSDITITETGSDPGGEFCQSFSLRQEQISQYFKQAEAITFKQLHDNHDYLPCFVKGSLTMQGQACDYTIRAGATAELSCSEGKQFFYACTTCEEIFTPKP